MQVEVADTAITNEVFDVWSYVWGKLNSKLKTTMHFTSDMFKPMRDSSGSGRLAPYLGLRSLGGCCYQIDLIPRTCSNEGTIT